MVRWFTDLKNDSSDHLPSHYSSTSSKHLQTPFTNHTMICHPEQPPTHSRQPDFTLPKQTISHNHTSFPSHHVIPHITLAHYSNLPPVASACSCSAPTCHKSLALLFTPSPPLTQPSHWQPCPISTANPHITHLHIWCTYPHSRLDLILMWTNKICPTHPSVSIQEPGIPWFMTHWTQPQVSAKKIKHSMVSKCPALLFITYFVASLTSSLSLVDTVNSHEKYLLNWSRSSAVSLTTPPSNQTPSLWYCIMHHHHSQGLLPSLPLLLVDPFWGAPSWP